MAKNMVYGFSRHPDCRAHFEHAIHMDFFVLLGSNGSPPPELKENTVLRKQGGVFFVYAKTEKIFFCGIDYKFSLDKTIKIVYIEAVKTISLVQRRIYI